ncbi:MAG: hypothetical protein IJ364_02415 [Oscillospiraceae bacterium]|nr:hypothetical protein [Oscillospiraceae bacterium]
MKKKKLLIFCMLFLLLDIAAASFLIGSIINDRRENQGIREALAIQVGVDENMEERQQQELYAAAVGDAGRLVSMYSEPQVIDGNIMLYLSNAQENGCAVSVEISLMTEDRVLAQSGLIEPGWRLEALPLDTELEAGEYYCLARCSFYTMEENAFLGQSSRQLLLKVQ